MVGVVRVPTGGADSPTTPDLPAVEVVTLDVVGVDEADPPLSGAERMHAANVAEINTTRPGTVLIVFKDRPGARAPRLAIPDKKRGRA